MRRLALLLLTLAVAALLLNRWSLDAAFVAPTEATASVTPLPANDSLLPPFTPAYACALQNVEVDDSDQCRRESVAETSLVQTDDAVFIEHRTAFSTGCWGSVRQMQRELHVCDPVSGVTRVLTEYFVTDFVASPDGMLFVYGTMNPLSEGDDALRPHVYRVRADGTDVTLLDSEGLPDFAVGAATDLHWLDADWIGLSLWDGTTDGWYAYRLRADGSGVFEPFGEATAEPS